MANLAPHVLPSHLLPAQLLALVYKPLAALVYKPLRSSNHSFATVCMPQSNYQPDSIHKPRHCLPLVRIEMSLTSNRHSPPVQQPPGVPLYLIVSLCLTISCTAALQPPETLTEGTLSRATDIYSLGVIMWTMYTGSRPWAGLSHGQVGGGERCYRW